MTLRDAIARKLRYWRDKYGNPNFNLYDIDTMADTICRVSSDYMISVFVILAQMKWESNAGLNPKVASRSKKTKNLLNVGNVDDGGNRYFNTFYDGIEAYGKFMRKNHYCIDGEWFFIEDIEKRQLKNGKGFSYATAPGYWQKIFKSANDIREDFVNYGCEDIL